MEKQAAVDAEVTARSTQSPSLARDAVLLEEALLEAQRPFGRAEIGVALGKPLAHLAELPPQGAAIDYCATDPAAIPAGRTQLLSG
jgi:hypothetical protein